MKKRTFEVSFKKEVLDYMENEGCSAYKAARHFSSLHKCNYVEQMFRNWKKQAETIRATPSIKKRATGGGRKPCLIGLEEILADEVVDLRINKYKVTRAFIADRARMLACDHNIDDFKASNRWMLGFMSRFNFSLRSCTNLTTLTDVQLIGRAVDYMTYLRVKIPHINLSKTILMDETAVYFEDGRKKTVDFKGRRHVILKSTGFASMRITVVAGVWADGRRAYPLVIHKGNENSYEVLRDNGVLHTTQPRAWVNQPLIIKWIEQMFPLLDVSEGKCIVWDSCRVHIGKEVKAYCSRRNITLVVIPGGMTPYLQAGDIGIYKEFKDLLSPIIDAWKKSDCMEYTRTGNPKPPKNEIVRTWVKDAWRAINDDTIKRSICIAGFAENCEEWHIWNHDVYGDKFKDAWRNNVEREIELDELEREPEDDDIHIDDDLRGLCLD